VRFDQKSGITSQTFNVKFSTTPGTITGNASGISGSITFNDQRSSKPGINEVQAINLAVGTATGTFQIAVPYNGRTYTTTSLALTASAADVQTAVNTALSPVSGSVSVTKTPSGTDVTYELTYSGALAGKNLDNAVVSVLTNAPAAGGSFTLSYDGQTTAAITLSSTTSTQATSIQSALQALSKIGSNNVTVAYDSTSASTAPRFLVTFAGTLANQSVKVLTASGASLQHATVTPRVVTSGRIALGETQTVTLTKPTAAGTFTLSLTHNSVTYTTTELAFSATAADIQTALNAALASLSGGNRNRQPLQRHGTQHHICRNTGGSGPGQPDRHSHWFGHPRRPHTNRRRLQPR
jgi:hypothetical protein